MSLNQMKALPVSQLVAPNCALVLWATWPMLPHALEVLGAWGFTYQTGGAWAKQSKTGQKWAFGTGYILRSSCEPFLVGTTGRPTLGAKDARPPIQKISDRTKPIMHPRIRLASAP